MTITKFGQCCLLIEIDGKRILTDPGRFSVSQNDVTNLDLILITHEHADHLHSESLEQIRANNPNAPIVTNTAVGNILDELGFTYEILEGRDTAEKAGVTIEAYDGEHAEIFRDFNLVQNTGYFIADTLFYPGDAYTNPGKSVEILALPISGPWCKSADALEYAIAVKPKNAFPVHDWMLNEEGRFSVHGLFKNILAENKIAFTPLTNDETKEF